MYITSSVACFYSRSNSGTLGLVSHGHFLKISWRQKYFRRVRLELKGFSKNAVKEKTEKIFDTTIAILKKSNKEDISSQKAALKIAKEKVFKTENI